MIRRAEQKDIKDIKTLLGQVLYVHHVGRPDLFKKTGQKYTDEELKTLIEKTEDPIFVYEDEAGNVIGHCFCQTIIKAETPATYPIKTLYIDDLCIHQEVRKQHIGSEMYAYVKKYAKENGYYNITLHAWECNPDAVAFYKRQGLLTQSYTMEELC